MKLSWGWWGWISWKSFSYFGIQKVWNFWLPFQSFEVWLSFGGFGVPLFCFWVKKLEKLQISIIMRDRAISLLIKSFLSRLSFANGFGINFKFIYILIFSPFLAKGPPQLKKTHFFQFLAEIFLTPPYDFQFSIVNFIQNPDASSLGIPTILVIWTLVNGPFEGIITV